MMALEDVHPLEEDTVSRYQDQLYELTEQYRKLEKKYQRLQRKYQDRMWIIKKQNNRIKKLSGGKLSYRNEPQSVRKAKGKLK